MARSSATRTGFRDWTTYGSSSHCASPDAPRTGLSSFLRLRKREEQFRTPSPSWMILAEARLAESGGDGNELVLAPSQVSAVREHDGKLVSLGIGSHVEHIEPAAAVECEGNRTGHVLGKLVVQNILSTRIRSEDTEFSLAVGEVPSVRPSKQVDERRRELPPRQRPLCRIEGLVGSTQRMGNGLR